MRHDQTLPRLLSDLVRAPGQIKMDYDDFVVEEIPLYPADDHGTHCFFLLEKRGVSTMQAVRELARALNVGRREIGYAGLKDARAVTRQWMSVEHVDPDALRALELPRMRVLDVKRHHNKLRLGHLRGNRFVIRVRQTEPQRLAELQDGLRILVQRGAPNYFGVQRFGARGDSWRVGHALVLGDADGAVDLLLGRPQDGDIPTIRVAREHYERGNYELAMRSWPAMYRDERRALKALLQSGGKKKRALGAVDHTLLRLLTSAYQSHLFNAVIEARLPTGLDQLMEGDLAWLHASGAVFRVEDLAVDQPRAERFDISPSGPLFGYRMTQPEGTPGEIENRVLHGEGLEPGSFRNEKLKLKGARRPLRFQPQDASLKLAADDRGVYLELVCVLPSGCYATTLLRELFSEPSGEQDETEGDEAEASSQ